MASHSKPRRIANWTLSILLCLFFLGAGIPKLLGQDTPSGGPDDFAAWGYPAWFRYVVGAWESLGAALLLAPGVALAGLSLRFWGTTVLGIDMVGAIATHLVHGEHLASLLPVALVLMLAMLWFQEQPWRNNRHQGREAAS